jgi:predicted PurR-regulated permease PerM
VADPYPLSADALLGLLLPMWQLVIAGCVLAAMLVSVQRLRRRGPSRMVNALLVTGVAIMGLTLVGLLLGR